MLSLDDVHQPAERPMEVLLFFSDLTLRVLVETHGWDRNRFVAEYGPIAGARYWQQYLDYGRTAKPYVPNPRS